MWSACDTDFSTQDEQLTITHSNIFMVILNGWFPVIQEAWVRHFSEMPTWLESPVAPLSDASGLTTDAPSHIAIPWGKQRQGIEFRVERQNP